MRAMAYWECHLSTGLDLGGLFAKNAGECLKMKCDFCYSSDRVLALVPSPPAYGYLVDLIKWQKLKYITCAPCLISNRRRIVSWLTEDLSSK